MNLTSASAPTSPSLVWEGQLQDHVNAEASSSLLHYMQPRLSSSTCSPINSSTTTTSSSSCSGGVQVVDEEGCTASRGDLPLFAALEKEAIRSCCSKGNGGQQDECAERQPIIPQIYSQEELAELGISYSVLYPKLQPHDYPIPVRQLLMIPPHSFFLFVY